MVPRRKREIKRERCNTWIDCDIYERVKKLSDRKGSSVYNYLNEMVETSTELEERGFSTSTAGGIFFGWNILRTAGLVLSPASGGTSEDWKKAGVRLGTLLKHQGATLDSIMNIFAMILECVGHVERQDRRLIVGGLRINDDMVKMMVEMIGAAASSAGVGVEVKFENGLILLSLTGS